MSDFCSAHKHQQGDQLLVTCAVTPQWLMSRHVHQGTAGLRASERSAHGTCLDMSALVAYINSDRHVKGRLRPSHGWSEHCTSEKCRAAHLYPQAGCVTGLG